MHSRHLNCYCSPPELLFLQLPAKLIRYTTLFTHYTQSVLFTQCFTFHLLTPSQPNPTSKNRTSSRLYMQTLRWRQRVNTLLTLKLLPLSDRPQMTKEPSSTQLHIPNSLDVTNLPGLPNDIYPFLTGQNTTCTQSRAPTTLAIGHLIQSKPYHKNTKSKQ